MVSWPDELTRNSTKLWCAVCLCLETTVLLWVCKGSWKLPVVKTPKAKLLSLLELLQMTSGFTTSQSYLFVPYVSPLLPGTALSAQVVNALLLTNLLCEHQLEVIPSWFEDLWKPEKCSSTLTESHTHDPRAVSLNAVVSTVSWRETRRKWRSNKRFLFWTSQLWHIPPTFSWFRRSNWAVSCSISVDLSFHRFNFAYPGLILIDALAETECWLDLLDLFYSSENSE